MSTPSSRRPHRRRGGRGGAEPRARILEREQRAWDLSIWGRTQREIAGAVGITQPAVSKLLRRVSARLRRDSAHDTAQWMVRVEAQLQLLVREGLDGWTRSQRDRTRKRERRIEPGAGEPVARRVTEITVESHAGDPRFLREVNQALVTGAQLRRWAPPPDPTPPLARVRLDALSAEEWALYARLHARLIGAETATSPQHDLAETEAR
jgi:hypothetical protein